MKPKAFITPERIAATKRAMLRIAEVRINALGLDCTPEEYVGRCQGNQAAGSREGHRQGKGIRA